MTKQCFYVCITKGIYVFLRIYKLRYLFNLAQKFKELEHILMKNTFPDLCLISINPKLVVAITPCNFSNHKRNFGIKIYSVSSSFGMCRKKICNPALFCCVTEYQLLLKCFLRLDVERWLLCMLQILYNTLIQKF